MIRSTSAAKLARGLALSAAALATLAALPAAPAFAQEQQQGEPGRPDFAAVTKDMQAMPGLMTLLRYKPDDATKDQTRLLAVVPRALLNQDLLLATSISRGPNMGNQWADYLVRWQQVGQRLVLSVPDTRFVETPGQPVTDAVRNTYTPSFLAALPILTTTPQGDPVVDLGGLLISRAVDVEAPAGTEPRRDLSRYTKVKVFPDNILIDVDQAYATRTGQGLNIGVSFAFRRLPDLKGYAPRAADERVGYFTTVRQDWNTKYTERDNVVRFINRWAIRKKDPSLELSPPDKPIVFVIEKTVPLQWRRYVADGILEWNKAFEQVGIVGAIVVQQQTDDNEFADVDPEDARYNFIRWIVTGRAYAMGPSRADPRTGQILDADIIFDDSMLRYNINDFDVLGPRALAAQEGPELLQFLEENPSFIPMGQTINDVRKARETFFGQDTHDGMQLRQILGLSTPEIVPSRMNRTPMEATCNYATGVRQQLAMANLMALATPTGKKLPERAVGMALKETVAHEVGHTLGLRHNFKASAWLNIDEIKRRRDSTDEPTTGSVMDYNALLFFAGDEIEKIRYFTTPSIGPYDVWAIEYGYRQADQKTEGGEAGMLKKIASRSAEPGLAYLTDEDVVGPSSPDPLANRWDMASDPVAWARTRIELVDALMKDLKTWAVNNDDPNSELRRVFGRLWGEKGRNLSYVSRIVGGQLVTRSRAGDPGAKPAFTLLPPGQQREAMQYLSDTVFNDAFFTVDAELFNELAPSRFIDWTGGSFGGRVDYPIHQVVLNMQNNALGNLVSPTVLQRVYDAELKSKAEDKYTAAEHVQLLTKVIWGDLKVPGDAAFTNAKPMLSSLKRNLQVQHLNYLLAAAESRPGALMSADLQSLIRFHLRELSTQIDGTLKEGQKIDLASRAHLTEARSRINRVLEAPSITLPSGGGGTIILQGAAPAAAPAE
jgi:hypothetical protein